MSKIVDISSHIEDRNQEYDLEDLDSELLEVNEYLLRALDDLETAKNAYTAFLNRHKDKSTLGFYDKADTDRVVVLMNAAYYNTESLSQELWDVFDYNLLK